MGIRFSAQVVLFIMHLSLHSQFDIYLSFEVQENDNKRLVQINEKT
jgi:hypothetical protein